MYKHGNEKDRLESVWMLDIWRHNCASESNSKRLNESKSEGYDIV
jgi:hypothetical protein